ncbi:TIGR03668 family PPOX class F420-dependent oxidoreductase [Sinosporangium siamense]|uniref:PPOX class F420-dependent oxidoreductase n=1 Tax=Sinosporangium siamense TaxID=1367973 RepID=A0A919RP39_9ACTN|nr:TIGR03668 family PPOX class F420-dependent oxidoreductase [Sinosporangium siamense]GII95574.1 PPOX class F420-dependent oxidoreductase [Sinosporangium siamense]
MKEDQARERLSQSRVARLATASADLTPHLVPVTFAVDGDHVVIAIDHKSKTTHNLRRLQNIRANPKVCLLADEYTEDWTQLWWARADGRATIREYEDRLPALHLLALKYPQYQDRVPQGPVIDIAVSRWSGWSYLNT